MVTRYISVFIIIIFFPRNSIAQNGEVIEVMGDNWYKVKGRVSLENLTVQKASRLAQNIACRSAIEDYSGVKVSSNSSYILGDSKGMKIDQYSQIIESASDGLILQKEILNEETITIEDDKYKSYYFEVTLKVKVGKQSGLSDPRFKLKTSLNRERFQHGDEMFISVKPSMDCYVTILNYQADETVAILFPNKIIPNNFVKAGEKLLLPNDEQRKKFRLRVGLLPDRDEDLERIKVFATKDDIPFTTLSSVSSLGTYESTTNEIIDWIIDIPKDKIVESTLQYWIYR